MQLFGVLAECAAARYGAEVTMKLSLANLTTTPKYRRSRRSLYRYERKNSGKKGRCWNYLQNENQSIGLSKQLNVRRTK